MQQYLDLMRRILDEGENGANRTQVDARCLFGERLRFNLEEGFPLLTTKKLHLHSILHELLWFLRGETNIRWLQERGVGIWNEWADADGELGPVYGHQWRHWGGDQIAKVARALRESPHSRRHIVSAWNADAIAEMALPPCHMMFQFHVGAGRLSCQMYQRSADYFLGVPFNIASYALLTMMMAQVSKLRPGDLIICFGNVHLYENHLQQAQEQLRRRPRQAPTMLLNPEIADIDAFKPEDFELRDYDPHPHIAAPVAV